MAVCMQAWASADRDREFSAAYLHTCFWSYERLALGCGNASVSIIGWPVLLAYLELAAGHLGEVHDVTSCANSAAAVSLTISAREIWYVLPIPMSTLAMERSRGGRASSALSRLSRICDMPQTHGQSWMTELRGRIERGELKGQMQVARPTIRLTC